LFTYHKYDKTYTKSQNKSEEHEYLDPQSIQKDYMGELGKLGVEMVKVDLFSKYAPNHQSDFFRWWFLKNFGGFYLGTDQIILKPFNSLPLKHKFIYSSYNVASPFSLSTIRTRPGTGGW